MSLIYPDDEDWPALCQASQTNGRATKRQTDCRRAALWALVETLQPATVRQIYYQATVHRIVDKTEAG
jgi:hypothetical protein